MTQTVLKKLLPLERLDDHQGRVAWLVCLSAGLFFFYEFFQLNLFDVINQALRDDFHLDAAKLSWMSSTYLWADLLFLLPAGMLLDRFSTRRVILVSLAVCILGTFGFALTKSFFWACFFHALAGIGNAFCFLACVVLVTHWFPPRRQALVIGSQVTMAFLGGMVAHTPLAYLYEHYGWRHALLVDAVVGIVFLVWIFFVVQDGPKARKATKASMTWAHLQHSLFVVLKNRQTWYAGLYTALLNLPIMVLCALWGATYLKVVHHLSDIAASNVVSLIFMGSIIGCPLVGFLSDTQGRRKPLMIFGAIVTLLTVLPLVVVDSLTVWQLSSLFFILGLVTSTQVISYPLIAESNAVENTGAATGIASIIIMGVAGVAQVLFGSLVEQHPLTETVLTSGVSDFGGAMWMFPCAAVFALLAIGLTRETYCKNISL